MLEEYAARWPGRIRLNLRAQNVGISRNWYEGLCQARGRFVCTLEGDDWWLSPHKLQKQADFLRSHPEYLAVSHRLQLIDDAGNTYGCLPSDARILGKEATVPLFLRGVTYSCTACMVRNIFLRPSPALERYVTANRSIADFALCMLYLDRGRVFVLDETLSAYRVAGADPTHKNYNATRTALKKYADFLDAVRATQEYFGAKYDLTRCYCAGTFFPLTDRIREGQLFPFLKLMGRMPLKAKLAFPFYFVGRCAVLAANRLARKGAAS